MKRPALSVAAFFSTMLMTTAVDPDLLWAQGGGLGAKDPQAIQVILNSIKAMGGQQAAASVRDSITQGTLTTYRGRSNSLASITIKTIGTNLIRTEVTEAGKTRTHIQRRDVAWVVEGGKTRVLPFHKSYNNHVEHIPLFSQMYDHGNSDSSLKYLGLGKVGPSTVYIIDQSREDASGQARKSGFNQLTLVEYLIDSTTFLPLRVRFFSRADNDMASKIMVESEYSDYRRIANITVPFQMDRYLRGQKTATLKITNILLNNGLREDEFRVP